MTRLQQAAYDAQFAAGLPVSELARLILVEVEARIHFRRCAAYIHAVQQAPWFTDAFGAHAGPITVVGGGGISRADATARRVKIGTSDRQDVGRCEVACLHELAHVVTADRGPGGEMREPVGGRASSKGHHHAWRANFVLIVANTLGKPAAVRLRREFNAWGLPTRR